MIFDNTYKKGLRQRAQIAFRMWFPILGVLVLSACASNPFDAYFRDTIKREDIAQPMQADKHDTTAKSDNSAESVLSQTDLNDISAAKPANANTSAPPVSAEQLIKVKVQMLSSSVNAYQLFKRQQSAGAAKQLNARINADASKALTAYHAGNSELALKHVSTIFADSDFFDFPQPAIYLLRGDIYMQQASSSDNESDAQTLTELALSDYQRAVSVFPDYPQGQNRLAVLYQQRGLFELALRHFNQAIVAWPGYTNAYRNRAILKDIYTSNKPSALDDYQLYTALLELQMKDCEMPQCDEIKSQINQATAWQFDLKRQLQVLNMNPSGVKK